MMTEKIKEITKFLEKSNNIALCIYNIDTFDKASAVVALINFLNAQKKQVTVLSEGVLVGRQNELFEQNKVSTELKVKPLSYVVSIDYGSTGLEKVSYETDEKTGKLNFYIFPTKEGFDLEKVEYKQVGANYDLTITLGVDDLKEMGSIYDSNEYLFKKNPLIAITPSNEKLGDVNLTIDGKKTFCELVYEIIKNNSTAINSQTIDIILAGILDAYKILESDVSTDVWSTISSLSKYGGNFSQVLRSAYYSKSFQNLDLQVKLMHNLRLDKKSKVVLSKVTLNDLKNCGIDKTNFDPKGRIIFNITSEFNLAIAVYEVSKDDLYVVIESNDPKNISAYQLAGVFGGEGDTVHAQCEIKNMPVKEFELRIAQVLKDLYNIDLRPEGIVFRAGEDESNHVAKAKTLTKGRFRSKNESPSNSKRIVDSTR